jgi:glyoxylase-like metal-dependent hydrolase (beta-lactamase superfamily II)
MTPLDRRSFLATLAAGAAATTLCGSRALAADEPRRFKHGAFEITVVSDGYLLLPTSFIAAGAPDAERQSLLQAAGQTGDTYQSPTNITLIRTADDLILIDIGSGDRFMPSAGKLWGNLEAAGIDKAAITKVILTHGHPDHLWGAADEFDELMLPKAHYYVAADEWDFWHGENAMRGLPTQRAGFVTGARRNYALLKPRMNVIQPGQDIVTGMRVVSTPGHTQGHISLELEGGDGLLIGGDALTHPLISFRHPDWRSETDHVPEQAAETRVRLLDRLATDRMTLLGFHLPFPGLGKVERKDGVYRYIAAL